jgi:hypothetical protein
LVCCRCGHVDAIACARHEESLAIFLCFHELIDFARRERQACRMRATYGQVDEVPL